MKIEKKNFSDFKMPPLGSETIETLASGADGFKIERIVSCGASSDVGFWYCQDSDELVMVLDGSAVLEFEDGRSIELSKFDYVAIPKFVKHRVAKTSSEPPCLWIAGFGDFSK